MNPKERRIPQRSHGEAVHRRRLLAEARQKAVFNIDQRIIDRSQAERRLVEIDKILSPDDQSLAIMDREERERTKVGLEVEHIWLEFRLGIITSAEKQSKLAVKFDEVWLDNEDRFNWLTSKNEHGVSMAEKIRDKVIPPMRVAGYYTKR